MNPASSNRNIPAWKPLVLASALATLSFPSMAQVGADQTLSAVTVSGSRFASGPESAPIGATVITSDQIREAGINNANEAIRKIGGVFGRQSTYGTSDFSLDLRGFGSNSDQNVVIMVDGIRLSENESATALMSSIPVDSIERIEIVRGGSSVLYGEGATSGVIQIITKKGAAGVTSGSLVAVAGSRDYRELRASLRKGWDNFSIDANVSGIQTDNYRYNNALRQENFSGGLQWSYANGRIGVRVDAARQDAELAGGITTLVGFYQNPRQSSSTRSSSIDTERYSLFTENHWGNWELATDLSQRYKRANSGARGAVPNKYDGEVTQFSPRLRHVYVAGGLRNELVFGTDIASSSRRYTPGSGTLNRYGSQDSLGIYAKDEIQSGKARVSIGARRENFDQQMVGDRAYKQSFALNAADLQGSYEITPLVNVFAKVGRSYRVGNIDDNTGTTRASLALKPQTSNDFELGSSVGNERQKLTAKFFRHELKNEIYYDRSLASDIGTGANTNLDPTQREGIELEARAKLTQDFSLVTVLQHVSAKFVEGRYAGREMTLVPKNNATMRLNWVAGNGHSADIGVQWVDKQRYGGDFSNTCNARMPAYTIVDGRYAIRSGAWEFAISGTNLTGKDYFSQAFGVCTTNNASIYSDPGRAVKLSARFDF